MSHAQYTLSTFLNVFVCFCCFWFLSVWRGCRWDWRWRGIVETEKDGAARGRSPPLMRTTTFPLWEQPYSHFENNHLPTLKTTTFPLWEQPYSHFENNHLPTLRTTIFPLWEHPPSHFENNHIPTLGKTTLREIFSNSWEQPEINHPWEQPHYHLENNQLPTLRTTSSVEEKYLYIY